MDFVKNQKKLKKKSKRLIKLNQEKRDDSNILNKKDIVNNQLNTPIKKRSKFIKTSILNNSSQMKKSIFTPKNTNISLLFSTTEKTRKRINKRKSLILCENLNNRLTLNKNHILLNENH